MSRPQRRSPVGAMTLGASVTVVSVLPLFLTSALVVQLTDELAFGTVGLGVAVALNRAAAAASSPFLGRLSDQLGASRSVRLAAVIAMVCSLGIALTAARWIVLAGWLLLSGCANALAQPAANRLLSTAVPRTRLGTAFGLKQSAPPTASMLAGLSVPVIALTLGWRWAFGLASLAALVVVITAGSPATTRTSADRRASQPAKLSGRKSLVMLAIAFGFGALASTAVTTFYVDAAVKSGSSASFAGFMLALSSAAAITMRILTGVVSDRFVRGHLWLCAGMMASGAVGMVLLSQGSPTMMAIGAVVALGGTWGFQGVFWFALVSAYPDAPGRATGAVFPGGLIGGVVGPSAFGLVVEWAGYPTAWLVAGSMSLVGGVLMGMNARRLREQS